jgi:NAD(P)-dependent dehydrogenase (short-subunit alcohol dehydrogenase family)
MDFTHYQPAPDLLAGRVILVTGAGSDIGRVASLAYARHGATLILLGERLTDLEALYDEIVAAGGADPAIFPLNLEVASAQDCLDLATGIASQLGRLDGLLHNAATLPYLSRISDYDPSDWDKTLRVDLSAPFLLTQACLPLLQAAPDAALVFLSDALVQTPKAFWGAYGVAKAGLDHLMRVLAAELENTPVRVNSLDPGPTRTNLRHRALPGEDTHGLHAPEALMPALLWLMGADASEVRGQTVRFAPEPA